MTFADWVRETRAKFRRDPPRTAARAATQEFWVGTLARAGDVTGRNDGVPIWTNDFDVCCVVDSCRLDVFNEVCETGAYPFLPRESGSIRSVGSMSPEWIHNTFSPAHDTSAVAYITGNVFSSNGADAWSNLPLSEPRVGYLDEAWRYHWEDDIEGGISTVRPSVLTDKAIDIWRRREALDIEQVVIHYMQPHEPFRSIPEHFATERGKNPDGERVDSVEQKNIWRRCRDGEISRDALWKGYRDNLRWVLDSISRLVDNCDGTVAITSDHGNGFGEFGVWGHPPHNPLSVLREVPWVTVDATDGETYEPTVKGKDLESERDHGGGDGDVESRLSALGYR